MYKRYESKVTLPQTVSFPYFAIPPRGGVLLYGAGAIGQSYYKQLMRTKYVDVVQWCDSNIEGKNLPLISREQIDWNGFDYVVIAINNINAAKEIYSFFRENGIVSERIIWSEEWPSAFLELEERYIERIALPSYKRANGTVNQRPWMSLEEKERFLSGLIQDFVKNKHFILPEFVVILGTGCTLKCKYCNNLMPYFKKPFWLNADDIIKDIKRVLENVDGIISLDLIGGEPFLYPELTKVLHFVVEQEKIYGINLLTNASLILKDNVLNALKNPKILVQVSDYSVVANTDKFINTLIKNNVRYEVFKELNWIDSGEPIERGNDENYLRYAYANCHPAKFCKALLSGKIYACARSASLYSLGCVNDPDGYVDIYDASNLKGALKKFFVDKDTDPACGYCTHVDKWRGVVAGEQIIK